MRGANVPSHVPCRALATRWLRKGMRGFSPPVPQSPVAHTCSRRGQRERHAGARVIPFASGSLRSCPRKTMNSTHGWPTAWPFEMVTCVSTPLSNCCGARSKEITTGLSVVQPSGSNRQPPPGPTSLRVPSRSLKTGLGDPVFTQGEVGWSDTGFEDISTTPGVETKVASGINPPRLPPLQ